MSFIRALVLTREPPNNSMQRTALRAAADAERYRAETSSAFLAG
jgi:hypothetical protein